MIKYATIGVHPGNSYGVRYKRETHTHTHRKLAPNFQVGSRYGRTAHGEKAH